MKLKFQIVVFFTLLFFLSCDLEKIETGPNNTKPTFESFVVLDASLNIQVETVLEGLSNDYLISGNYSTKVGSVSGIFIAKFNESGNLQKLVKDHGNSNALNGGKMIRTKDNKYVLVGSEVNASSDYNIAIIKYDKDLVRIGQVQTYGNANLDELGNCIVEMDDINYLIGGLKNNGSQYGSYFLKISSSNGSVLDELFDNSFPASRNSIQSIAKNGSNYGALGYNLGISVPFSLFINIDQNLNIVVSKKDLQGFGDIGGEIIDNNSAGFVVANSQLAQFIRQAIISKIDASGIENTPSELFTSFADSGLEGLAKDSKNQFVCGGWTGDVSIPTSNASAVLLSSNLDIIESYFYTANNQCSFNAVTSVTDGGFLLAGQSGDKALLVKLNNKFKL